MLNKKDAQRVLIEASGDACVKINEFAHKVLRTRGGRIGSGMGTLFEALWGYFVNQVFEGQEKEQAALELAWMPGQEYNDFACVGRNCAWDPIGREGELFRIETKCMVASADESKAHFDQLVKNLSQYEMLVIIVWDWKLCDRMRVCPQVLDHYVGPASPIAVLRDRLHVVRGGSFVDSSHCPDGCEPAICRHGGEPLNASGKRERLTGPESVRVSRSVSYAANFGGMVRMLKTTSEVARAEFRKARRENDVAHAYISFIHRNFPKEEANQYTMAEWQRLAQLLEIEDWKVGKRELIQRIQEERPDYKEALRGM